MRKRIAGPGRFPGEKAGCLEFELAELEDILPGSKATELWSGENTEIGSTFSTKLPAHGAKVFYLA